MVKSKGFTLIELMVVIAIIGILASVIFGSIRGNGSRAPATISTETNDINNVMIINGESYSCDSQGECEPIR